ncbi:ABC transporter ATP-binding protein [uncultured Enterovirga sp.]|uniref:ABC transporter ATP-binding protein n=1 Tax=uncultured Enterovirga sp. TaxID=2026352 RepID=UPI0035C9F37A
MMHAEQRQVDPPGTYVGAVAAFRQLLSYTGLGWRLLALFGLLGLFASGLEGLGIGLLIPLFNLLTSGGTGEHEGRLARWLAESAPGVSSGQRAIAIGGSIIALVLLRAGITFASSAFASWLSTRVSHDLRRRLVGRILRGDFADLTAIGPARLLETVSADVWRATELITSMLAIVTQACTVLIFALVLAFLSWKLSLATLLAVGITALSTNLLTAHSRRLGDLITEGHVRLAAQCLEIAHGLRIVRVFGREEIEQARYERGSDEVRRRTFASEMLTSATIPLLEIVYIPIFVGALLLGRALDLDAAATLAFLILLYRMQGPIRAIGAHRLRMAGFAAAVRNVTHLLALPDAHSGVSTRPCPPLRRGIAFRDVSFRHGSSARPALDGIGFEIRRGSTVALVGRSGAGKSTLVNLLLGLYRPQRGAILVDGQDLVTLDISEWRSRVALAGQGADLVSGTLAENIAYGRTGAADEAIRRAAEAAAANAFIDALSEGYGTEIGFRGERLSGGQQQRLGLARALAREPDLLILDEATNALDGITGLTVRASLARLPGETTVLIIAHHLASIRMADRVLVLEEGRLVQDGTPDELLANEGAFARLYGLGPEAEPV